MNSPENTLKPEGCIDNTDANISANAVDNDNEKLDRDPNEIITVIELDESQGNLDEGKHIIFYL